MKEIWVASIVKGKKDGDVRLTYAGIDMNGYDFLTLDEFIQEVEASDAWDFIDFEVYENAFDGVGLDFGTYDDPDEAWDDFLEAAKEYE